jgi:hypothetical protein
MWMTMVIMSSEFNQVQGSTYIHHTLFTLPYILNSPSQILMTSSSDENNRTVATRFTLPLEMCGDNKHAETNVCVLDGETRMVLLIVENKTMRNRVNPSPQLLAEAFNTITTCGHGMGILVLTV